MIFNALHVPLARRIMAPALVGLLVLSPAAGAQENPQELLRDFVHFVNIAKPDLARDYAQKLLDSGISNTELTILLDEGQVDLKRFNEAVDRAMRVQQLEDIAAEVARRVEAGRLELAREEKRIKQAIGMLTGTQRQKLLARDRLVAAGEYAVPALVEEIVTGHDERLRLACERMLAEIQRLAVTPLCVVLPNLGSVSTQRAICDILGEIGHPHAAPALRELAMDPNVSEVVREAANRAYRRVGGTDVSLSTLYSNLAMSYFLEDMSLIAYPTEPTNNAWSYEPGILLKPTPVPTEVFGQVMAMQMARKSLDHDRDNSAALSIFVAANLKRENDLPEGQEDLVYGHLQYSPSFYATVYGTRTCLDVLQMALDTFDTPLVRDAIAALAETTGGVNLFERGDGRQPLLAALRYPDRRVQYEAALTLARAMPDRSFTGDYSVVRLLATAVRIGGESYAVVVAPDEEDRRALSSVLDGMDFTIVGADASVGALQAAMAEAVGVDLVVVKASTAANARQTIEALRHNPNAAAAPLVVIVEAAESPELEIEYRSDRRVRIARWRDEAALGQVVENALERASGGRISEAEAEEYAFNALAALRDIAVSGSSVYDIHDAEVALLEALETRSGGARLMVARILSWVHSDRTQRRLFDAALNATGDEQIELLDYVAASVRRFGSAAQRHHVSALLDLIAQSSGKTAEAAARVHGAMSGRPTPDAIDLIP